MINTSTHLGERNMANPILVTGAAGRVGAVGRTVTDLLLKQGKAVRAMVRTDDILDVDGGAHFGRRSGANRPD